MTKLLKFGTSWLNENTELWSFTKVFGGLAFVYMRQLELSHDLTISSYRTERYSKTFHQNWFLFETTRLLIYNNKLQNSKDTSR